MARYLIDTDVMVDVSRRIAVAATYVDSLDDITISIITAHELIVGARNQRDADGIDSLINTFPVHADRRADYRLGLRATQAIREIRRSAHLRCSNCRDCYRGRPHASLEEPKALPDDRGAAS